MLVEWLTEEEHDAQFVARLRAAAQQWAASGEAEGLLWRDRAAEEAKRWLTRRTEGELTSVGRREERYLEAVVALSARARRARRMIGTAVFIALSAAVAGMSYLAVRAQGEARRAENEALDARNAARMAAAGRAVESDATTALVLLREIEGGAMP